MKVREIASALATTPDTVRYYTRLQLITPAKSDNGYKFYSTKDASSAYFGESDRSFRFYPITFSSSFSSLPVLP